MTIQEIQESAEPFIDQPLITFEIHSEIFNIDNGGREFNRTIRNNIDNRFGVYILANNITNEILYIGMAGKIKTDGTFSDHTLQKRLQASRGRDFISKKDILTKDWVKSFMIANDVPSLAFHILYSRIDEPPTYLEALLLYKFYKMNNRLPRLNNAF